MRNILNHFKKRPKTTLVILLIAIALTIAWWTFGSKPGLIATPWTSTAYSTAGGMGIGEAGVPSVNAIYALPPTVAGRDAMMIGIAPNPEPTAGQTAAETDQKIIKNGYLQMVVGTVSDVVTSVSGVATTRGGFVQSSSVTERADGTHAGDITIRVPVEKFEETMTEIKKLAAVVKNETSTGQDVTEQYTDLQAQLRNAQAQEQTYLAILKQARTVEDTLKVQAQLGIIRGTIESLQGRITYLGNSTSYSTISVSLEEDPAVRAPTKEFRVVAIMKAAVQTLVAVAQDIVAGLIWLVIVWGGILAPLALVVWLFVRFWKRRGTTTKKR